MLSCLITISVIKERNNRFQYSKSVRSLIEYLTENVFYTFCIVQQPEGRTIDSPVRIAFTFAARISFSDSVLFSILYLYSTII